MPDQQASSRSSAVFTVSQLNQRAKQLLEISFAAVRVEGEISNLSRPSSGHWYFTLKDAGAQVRCAMFRSRTSQLKFLPKEGDMVEIRAKVSLYENRGDYQLIVDGMKPAGEGALLLAFEQLKRRLAAEGMFDPARKRPLPKIKRLAIITSPTGAAIHDMLTVLQRRWPMIEIDIYPTVVQGQDAPAQIIEALRRANRDQRADAIIVGRGGGSLEDLWCFNDEGVARAIAASELPVISAVGHEVDTSISDYAADLRAPTPSAAAELVSPDQNEWQQRLQQYEQRFAALQLNRLQQQRHRVVQLASRLRSPTQTLQAQMQRLDQLEQRAQRAMKQALANAKQRIVANQRSLTVLQPANTLKAHHKNLLQLQHRLAHEMQQLLSKKQRQLQHSMRLLNSVSPLAVLERGYTITQTPAGDIVQNTLNIKVGDTIETRLQQGKIISEITELHEPK